MKRLICTLLWILFVFAGYSQVGVYKLVTSDTTKVKDYRFQQLPNYSVYGALQSITSGDQNLATPPGTTLQRPTVPSGKIILRFNTDSNALEYGNSSQVWRTLAQSAVQNIDTSSIPNFGLKVKSQSSATTPILYNGVTGNISIQPANSSQAGYLQQADWITFNAKLPDPGSNGFLARTASGTTASRQLVASSPNISIVNPTGVSGNPAIDINDTLVLQTFQLNAVPAAAPYADSVMVLNRSTGRPEVRPVNSSAATSNTRRSITKAAPDSLQLVNDVSQSPELGKVFKYGMDSTGNTRGFIEEKYYVSKKVSELRTLRTADTATVYRTIINGIVGDFYWDPTSTATDDSVMVIKLGGVATGRLLRHFTWFISPDWFGAKPNDAIDDSYALQKAINFAIAHTKAPTVLLSGGTYYANDINIVNKSGSEYSFVTLKIKGSSFLIGNATVIYVNNANGFGLHVMIGRQVEIENITFTGMAPHITLQSQVISWDRSQWATGVRDNQHSPHAAIVVDGYHSSIISGDQYPGMSAYYSNSGTGGTSQLTIRNCSFKMFITAILEGAAGVIANGDNIKAQDCYFEHNRVAWACGQTQSRANSIENCYFLFHQFIVNGTDYGSQQGTPPNVKRCNIAGATKYLYGVNGSFSGLTFHECYSESLFAFGKCDAPVQFTDCELIMNTDPAVAFQPHRVAEGSQVSFKGGRFGYFDNLSKMAVAFNVTNLSFNEVTLLCLPVNINSTVFDAALGKTVFDNCHFIGNGQTGDTWESNTVNTSNFQTTMSNSIVVMPGYKAVFEDANKRVQLESKSPKIEYFQVDTKPINIDTPTGTAYFISSTPSAYQLYDVLTTDNSTSWTGDNSMFTAGGTVLGQVYAISVDTIKIKYVPYGLNESTNYEVLITRIPHFFPRAFGDVTSGSNTITNTHYPYWQPLVGDWIKGTGIPTGTRISAIAGSTITLTRNATATNTGVEFYDAKIYTEVKSRDVSIGTSPLGFTKGDVILNTREVSGNDSIAYWICSVPGVVGGTPAADFTYVKTGPATTTSPAHTFKGNNTGSTISTIDLTATQLTAELNTMAPGLKGLVPAPSGSPSSTKFLNETGTFTIPAGGGSPGGSNKNVQVNATGSFSGYNNFSYDNVAKRLTVQSATAPDLTYNDDHTLKILGPRMYIGDTTSNDPSMVEFGNPYATSRARMFCGWLGSEEWNWGFNLDYRFTGDPQHQYGDSLRPIIYGFLSPEQSGIQVVPKGFSNRDAVTGLKHDVYNLYGRVIQRFDYINDGRFYKGSRLRTNEIYLFDTVGMDQEMQNGTYAIFKVASASLKFSGVTEWDFADSVYVGIGGNAQTGYKQTITTGTGSDGSILYFNNGSSSSFNNIRFDKTVSGSHNVGAGVKNPVIDISGGVAEEGWISTSNAPGGFSNYEKYWKTTNSGGTTAERMRLKESGNLLINTTTDNGANLQVNGAATVLDDAYDATTWNGNTEVPTKNAIRDKIESLSSGGITSINSQTGSTQTIAASNGLTENSSSNTHTVTLGGSLSSTVTIDGASHALNLGSSGSYLSFMNVFGNLITLNGGLAMGVEDYGTDANHTLSALVPYVELHDVLSADRTITMPTPTRQGQVLTIVTRFSAGTNHYVLASGIPDNTTGSTFTQLDWGKTYDFYVNSGVGWSLIRKY